MSSNTSNCRGKKGSKFWIQTIINSDMKIELERQVGIGTINWISPLAKDSYAEYKLNQKNIIDVLGIPKTFYSFWPSKQPQWDAIGMTENTIVLVEAKAHLKELKSSLSATSEESIRLICETMGKVFDESYINGDFEKWKKDYYQLGNRLTFLKIMNEFVNKDGKQVKLVLLNIVNDPTYIPTSEEEWNNSYDDIFMEMTGSSVIPKNVKVVNFSV